MEAKRPQCTKTARSGKINRMPINEIWTNLRTFANKGCQKFLLVKNKKERRTRSPNTTSHIRITPWLPYIQGSEENQFKMSIFICNLSNKPGKLKLEPVQNRPLMVDMRWPCPNFLW